MIDDLLRLPDLELDLSVFQIYIEGIVVRAYPPHTLSVYYTDSFYTAEKCRRFPHSFLA